MGPSPNHNKMSVTNEEVTDPNNIVGGGSGGTPPTSVTTTVVSSSSSTLNGPSGNSPIASSSSSVTDDVVKSGYLRKLKGKKKFFVLRKETQVDKPARLEYYANEKKFRMGHPPKKSIVLKSCFNISGPEANLKCKYSISLHTHNDCVRISMNNEEEMGDWLRVMKALAGEEEDDHHTEGKPHFEHIWMVHALNKGLGSKENIIGPYRLCLTSKELTLLKVGEHDGRNAIVRFPLNVIRNVSHDATFGCFFHIELGRLASTGPGQLSLKTDDNNIAQNMHLLILKAMQNYSKEDIIPPRERARTYTWKSDSEMRPSHSTPPGINGLNMVDDPPRNRTDSMPSSISGRGADTSPPVPILTPTPTIFFNSPLYSTGTDSASSSYSIDYDNNNQGSQLHPDTFSKSNDEEESYVPYYPGEDQHPSLNSLGRLKLPFIPSDNGDYVDTSIVSKDSTSSNAHTPSSYMEMQSPMMSPFDNYLPMTPMSPAGAVIAGNNTKSNGKTSVSHSRNSSLVEDNECGYVPMIPGGYNSRSESGAGSTAGSATGLDDDTAYLNMDFSRKINLSNDDVRRASPASSESLQSNTPSSDFPLEKVSSYLTDDFDDSNSRPLRAYSVGSRSDTSSGKMRSGKNRLEAVQESFRIRAMSVGSKNPRKTTINPSTTSNNISMMANGGKTGVGPLSSSWGGSTGRWPLPKFSTNLYQPASQYQPSYSHSQATSESADSDLMELDFSKNKSKSRKRSLPGPAGSSFNSTPSSGGSNNMQKVSPAPKGAFSSFNEVSPNVDLVESPKLHQSSTSFSDGTANRKYIASAPISIKGCNRSPLDAGFVYPDNNTSSQSILTRLTGTDLKKLKEQDNEGAYLTMEFNPSQGQKTSDLQPRVSVSNISEKSNRSSSVGNSSMMIDSTVVVKPTNETSNKSNQSKFSLNLSSPSYSSQNTPYKTKTDSLVRPPICNGESTTISNNIFSSSAVGVKTPFQNNDVNKQCNSNVTPSTSSGPEQSIISSLSASSGLTRIEESPEKQDNSKASSEVTYAAISINSDKHLPPVGRSSSNACGSTKIAAVTYAQIDFIKSPEAVKPN